MVKNVPHSQRTHSGELYVVSIPAGVFHDFTKSTWTERSRAVRADIVDKSRYSLLVAMFSWGVYCVVNMLLMIAISIPFWKFYFEGISGLIFRVLMFIPLAGLFMSAFRYRLPANRRVYFSRVWDAAIIVFGLAMAISWANPWTS